MRHFGPVGNGRVLAYVMGGDLAYVRGTNVLRAISKDVEWRYAAVGDQIKIATSAEDWPLEFDPPPLGGATRAALVKRVLDLPEPDAVTELYARSVLVLALHQEVSGAFIAGPEDDVLIGHAMDVCGERGAAEAFFEWALVHRALDGLLMWGLEQHLRFTYRSSIREKVERLKDGPGPELAAEAPHLPTDGEHEIKAALRRRSKLDLFLTEDGIDLRAHALFLLAVHSLVPKLQWGEDFFFQHQALVQEIRRSRALYAGAFHSGLCAPGQDPEADVEVRAGLQPVEVIVEPTTSDRYKVKIETGDGYIWASDADPRPGGQEFAFGTDDAPPDWMADAVMYQIMVDRFARTGSSLPAPGSPTALYGGTLDGITEHLDHIEALGCNAIWLSPVHKSPSHHGYDHEDYYIVEPRYGGEAALKRLIDAAHARDIRVLLDFVPNHTGRGHHLFREAIAHDGDAADFYRFWQWPHYYRCFFDVITLPELDTGNPRVREYLMSAARHWVTEYGADGLRCDHVAGVDPIFWLELREGLRAVKSDVVVLGEATAHFDWLARYAGRLDAIFDFDFAHMVRQAFAKDNVGLPAFARWLDEHDHAFPGLALATLLDNHDMNRFLWMAGGDTARLKLAATLLMTLPGTPVIYYGTEVGLSQRVDGAGENAEARLPMLWGADQDRDLLEHFQKLGRLRRHAAALRRGSRRTLRADEGVLVYERSLGEERLEVTVDLRNLRGSVVDHTGRDRLREDDVLGVGPDQGPR